MQDPLRKHELAQIHIAKKALNLDDDVYRLIIRRVTKDQHDSAATLTSFQRRMLITEFRRLGWVQEKHGRKPKVASSNQSVLSKIEALLAKAGRRWEYAEGIATRMFQVKKLEFCTPEQLRKILQALIIDQGRRSANHEQTDADQAASAAPTIQAQPHLSAAVQETDETCNQTPD